ncbi:MAG: GW dipeptide domain-containing protein [Bacteroidota bacterium]
MKIGLACVLFLGLCASLRAQTPQLAFEEANKLLEQSQYADAMKAYHDIERSGNQAGALFLNMAIASVQLDSMGLAKVYFKAAGAYPSTAESAERGLEFVESQFSRQSARLPKLPWDRAVDNLKEWPTSFGLFFIAFTWVLISTALFLVRWFSSISIPNKNILVGTALGFSFFFAVLALYVDYIELKYDEGVIISSEVNVMAQPAFDANLVSVGYEGFQVTVDQKTSTSEKDWMYIRLGNGQFGWLPAQHVKVIP